MIEKLHNMQAEQIILGTLLYDTGAVDGIEVLHPSDFSVPEHTEIYARIQADMLDGKRPSYVSMMPIFKSMKVANIDGAVYLGRLATLSDRTILRECIASVKELSARRSILGIGEGLKNQSRNPGLSPQHIALAAITALDGAISAARSRLIAPAMIEDAAVALVDDLDSPDDGSIISTGLRSLDVFIGGWARGEMAIVAGRPSMGKSALLVTSARRAAERGVTTLLFSLEMPKRAVVARMLSDFAFAARREDCVPYSDILRKRLTSAQKQRIAWAVDNFKGLPIKVDDQPSLSMAEIQIRARKYADELAEQGKRLDVVMVDHIGKIKASDRYAGNMVHEVGEKSDALMTMGKELSVAVVAAHQLNRGTEGREDKHPTPADLRDSGNLEQDAHTLIFPYRQSYYLERQKHDDPTKEAIRLSDLKRCANKLEILVAKSRNGACGTVDCFVDMANNAIWDLHRE